MHLVAAAAASPFSFSKLSTWIIVVAAPLALLLLGLRILFGSGGQSNMKRTMHMSANALAGLFWIGMAGAVVAFSAFLAGLA